MIQGVEDRARNHASFLILVVDDDEDIRDLVTYILNGSGFQVVTAIDGSNALLQIEKHQPDLILLDVMLSDFSGLEVLKLIRNSQEAAVRQIPVILLSAMLEKPDFESYATFGVTEFLPKPFQSMVLVERVTAMVTANTRPASPLANRISPKHDGRMELPEVESLVTERRAGVLSRAIGALEDASIDQLQRVSHKIAGALSIYSFVAEGSQARTFSQWLAMKPDPETAEVLGRRDELLDLLRRARA